MENKPLQFLLAPLRRYCAAGKAAVFKPKHPLDRIDELIEILLRELSFSSRGSAAEAYDRAFGLMRLAMTVEESCPTSPREFLQRLNYRCLFTPGGDEGAACFYRDEVKRLHVRCKVLFERLGISLDDNLEEALRARQGILNRLAGTLPF